MAICNGIGECARKSGNFDCKRGNRLMLEACLVRKVAELILSRDGSGNGFLAVVGMSSEEHQKCYEEVYDLQEDDLYLVWASLKGATGNSIERDHCP